MSLNSTAHGRVRVLLVTGASAAFTYAGCGGCVHGSASTVTTSPLTTCLVLHASPTGCTDWSLAGTNNCVDDLTLPTDGGDGGPYVAAHGSDVYVVLAGGGSPFRTADGYSITGSLAARSVTISFTVH